MTFVQYGNRAFADRSILQPLRRRSESRLKTYPSAIDLRTWCDTVEERRQHIVEHITKDIAKCYGKLIPLDAIINALTGGRGANCEALAICFKKLLDFVNSLNLSDEDKNKFQLLMSQMDKACRVAGGLEDGSGSGDAINGKSNNQRLARMGTDNDNYRILKDDDCDPDCMAKPRHDREKAEVNKLLNKLGPGEQGKVITTFKGPGVQKHRIRGISPGFVVGPTKEEPGNITVKAGGTPSKVKTTITNAKPKPDSQPKSGPLDPSELVRTPVRSARTNAPDENSTSMSQSKSESGCGSLRDKLAARDALCEEQQTKLQEIQNERDALKQKLEDCMKELENFKTITMTTNPNLPESCQEEIATLEAEIKIMRSGNPSPEQEADIIKKEIDVLKRYCTKLKHIEDENLKLKEQLSVNKGVGDGEMIDDLREKLDKLEKLQNERDALANKVHMLEEKLRRYEDLPGEVEELRSRSQMLDTVMKERDDMSQKCKAMKSIEAEVAKLKLKADRVDELERELKSYSKFDNYSGTELKRTQSICGCLENELRNAKSEKEAMNRRIENMRKELDLNRRKIKENEILRLERDRLQIQLNQLQGVQEERDHYKAKYDEILEMECTCEMLKRQLQEANSVGRERDYLKKQVNDLESCICDQESEIKNLVNQIDSFSRNSNADTEHLLNTMKNEVKLSNEKLMSERTKIAQLEKTLHRAEMTIRQKECHIKCLEQQIKNSKKLNKEEMEQVECMCNELDVAKAENKKLQEIANKMAGLTGDKQMKKMLQQSECAAKRLVEELGKHYRMEHGDNRNKNRNNDSMCTCSESESDDCEKLRMDLESLEKEKEVLQKNLKQFQRPKGDDKQIKKMLQQSECAAKRLVEELGKHYRVEHGDNRNKNRNQDNTCRCSETECLEEEKEVLQKNLKQFQGPKGCRC